MSRLVRAPIPVEVATDSDGTPRLVEGRRVFDVSDHFREWIGALAGEPERDIWRLRTERGIVEVHHVLERAGAEDDGKPRRGAWFLTRWED